MNKSTDKIPFLDEDGVYKIPKVPKELTKTYNWKNDLTGIILLGLCVVVFLLSELSGNLILIYVITLMFLFVIFILFIIPQTWILSKITKRTKSIAFLKELFLNSLIFILFSIGWLGIFFNHENSTNGCDLK